LEQVVGYLSAGAPLQARPAVLTFDDGYTNAYQVAVPILAERHESATFFLSPAMLGFGAYLDWTEINDMLAKGMTVASHGWFAYVGWTGYEALTAVFDPNGPDGDAGGPSPTASAAPTGEPPSGSAAPSSGD
jgi:hypothetical protein